MVWITVVTVASVVLLVIAEVGIRWWLRHQGNYNVWPPYLRLELHPDPDVFPELERTVRVGINRDGERGGEPPASKDGFYRILVAGGSQTECALLDQATSWPGALESNLKKPEHLGILGTSRVHVGNIGLSGLSAAHLDVIFEHLLPRYEHLNAILINIGGNDVLHWLIRGAPISYHRGPILKRIAFSHHPEGPFGYTPRSTATAELMRRLHRRLLHPVKVRDRSGAWLGVARRMRAQAKEMRTSMPDPSGMLDDFEHHFRRIVEMAKDHADRVLIIRQPWFQKEHYTQEEEGHFWHGGVGDAFEGDNVTVFYSLEVVNIVIQQLDLRAAKVAKECHVENLNLMPLLEPSLKTFYDFHHFTPAGAAEVAAIIARTLLRPHRAHEDN
jgi:hypothetical protein